MIFMDFDSERIDDERISDFCKKEPDDARRHMHIVTQHSNLDTDKDKYAYRSNAFHTSFAHVDCTAD